MSTDDQDPAGVGEMTRRNPQLGIEIELLKQAETTEEFKDRGEAVKKEMLAAFRRRERE
jgi:hypothetical protein